MEDHLAWLPLNWVTSCFSCQTSFIAQLDLPEGREVLFEMKILPLCSRPCVHKATGFSSLSPSSPFPPVLSPPKADQFQNTSRSSYFL